MLEKRGAFRTLAVSRMGSVLDAIRKISNCSNKSHYAYSFEEIREMRDALVHRINYEFAKFGFDKEKSLEIKIEESEKTEITHIFPTEIVHQKKMTNKC